MGYLSKLDAVNRILRGSSENPVSSLIDTQINETLMAETVLDETSIREQMSGLHCNTVAIELEPEPDNTIILPDTVLQVYSWYLPDGGKSSLDKNFATRGHNPTLLFDVKENTDQFDESQVVRYTLLLDFEDLPTAEQFRITDIAAQVYQMAVQGDNAVNQMLTQIALHSRALGRAHDIRTYRANSFLTGRSPGPKQIRLTPRRWW